MLHITPICKKNVHMKYYRTKVECAGLCLSEENCHVFKFVKGEKDNYFCTLYDKEGTCIIDDSKSIETYADQNTIPPYCPGKTLVCNGWKMGCIVYYDQRISFRKFVE